jgi:hypothetical protein
MSLQYVGSLSIGAIFPTVFAAFASLDTNIQAQLTGALNMQISVGGIPANVAATIEVAASILANLEASASLAPPSISLSASLSANIAALESLIASLSILLAFESAGEGGGAVGIDVFAWSGPVGSFGAAIASALASGAPSGGAPADPSNAFVLLTRSSATWAAMSSFFAGAA